MEFDPYTLLGVEPDASQREIDRARSYAHRILGEIASSIGREGAVAQAAAIDRAWETLRDPDRRSAVDEMLRADATGMPAGGHATTAARGASGAPGKTCSVCLSSPAMTMHFRQRMSRKTIESVSGVYCRTCGIATFRETTNRTLLQGFWRARSLITTIAIVQGNTRERRRMNRLAESEDVCLATHPGRPLFLRSGVIAVVVSAMLVTTTVVQIVEGASVLTKKNPLENRLPIG